MKILLTVLSTVVLMLHTRPIGLLAAAVAAGPVGATLHDAQRMMVVASGAALVALGALTALSIFKPRGITPFGL